MSWNPAQYLKFAGPRMRPGLDLIARIPALPARRIVDLGCGAGGLTALLADRWPEAETVGIDSSPEMLATARNDHPALDWRRDDIRTWRPDRRPDLIYSNAALHWTPDHARLFPRLVEALAPGGALAIQMPRNFHSPSHRLVAEIAGGRRWSRPIDLSDKAVLEPAAYYDILSGVTASLDIWETEYLHVLEGDRPVLEWTRSTTLRPVFDALEGDELSAFLEEYARGLDAAYPKRADGRTLFTFRRLFLLARRD